MLVAGGLGERLGYSGIKIALPTDLARGACFLQVLPSTPATLPSTSVMTALSPHSALGTASRSGLHSTNAACRNVPLSKLYGMMSCVCCWRASVLSSDWDVVRHAAS